MREVRHDLIPANAIDPHEPEPLELHDLIQFLLNPALPDADIFSLFPHRIIALSVYTLARNSVLCHRS